MPTKSLGNTGAMIALYPPVTLASDLERLAAGIVAVTENPDDLHVTLLYLGEAEALGDRQGALEAMLQVFAGTNSPVFAHLNGTARFDNADGEAIPFVALVDSPQLPGLRQSLLEAVQALGLDPVLNHGFIPHITLSYLPPGSATPTLVTPSDGVLFEKLSLVLADARYDFPFYYPRLEVARAFENVKSVAGQRLWRGIVSVNTYDREGEVATNAALREVVDLCKAQSFYPELRFFHLTPGQYKQHFAADHAPGVADWYEVVDGHLVATGHYYNDPVSKAMADYVDAHPEGTDGSGWGMSWIFGSYPDREGAFQHIRWAREFTFLPYSQAAHPKTRFSLEEAQWL